MCTLIEGISCRTIVHVDERVGFASSCFRLLWPSVVTCILYDLDVVLCWREVSSL